MTTINISLPEQLKKEAEILIGMGYYASFSDLVRDSLRKVVAASRYHSLYVDLKNDEKTGRAISLKSKKDIEDYFKKI